MQSNIQIQDLEANYLTDLENSSVAGVYGGCFLRAIYEAGYELGRFFANR